MGFAPERVSEGDGDVGGDILWKGSDKLHGELNITRTCLRGLYIDSNMHFRRQSCRHGWKKTGKFGATRTTQPRSTNTTHRDFPSAPNG